MESNRPIKVLSPSRRPHWLLSRTYMATPPLGLWEGGKGMGREGVGGREGEGGGGRGRKGERDTERERERKIERERDR